MELRLVIAVGTGGFAGAVARYALAELFMQLTTRTGFPLGTFAANLSGCFLIGLLAGVAAGYDWPVEARALVMTGFLGALTTFSTFSFENVNLLRTGYQLTALLNVMLQLLVGFGAVWLGDVLARRL